MSVDSNTTASDNADVIVTADLLTLARTVADEGYRHEVDDFLNSLGLTLLNQPGTVAKNAVANALTRAERSYGSEAAREQVAKAREALGIVVEREYNDSYNLSAAVTAAELRQQGWDGSQDTLVTYAQRVLEAGYRYGEDGTGRVTVETVPDPARTA